MTDLEQKVIERDEDTAIEDKNDGGLYPYDPAYESIEISDDPYSIFEYLRQLEKGKITIQPDFQRNQVWNPVQKSKFIESIILNFPLPPIYLNENSKNNCNLTYTNTNSTLIEKNNFLDFFLNAHNLNKIDKK